MVTPGSERLDEVYVPWARSAPLHPGRRVEREPARDTMAGVGCHRWGFRPWRRPAIRGSASGGHHRCSWLLHRVKCASLLHALIVASRTPALALAAANRLQRASRRRRITSAGTTSRPTIVRGRLSGGQPLTKPLANRYEHEGDRHEQEPRRATFVPAAGAASGRRSRHCRPRRKAQTGAAGSSGRPDNRHRRRWRWRSRR